MQRRRTSDRRPRHGAVAVEFAFIAPLLLTLVLGVCEASRLLDAQGRLLTAARDGARLAAMDREQLLAEGQSTNEKITQDIRNFLDAYGMPGDEVNISITDADNPDGPFDLDDPANDLKLFRISVELPYSALVGFEVPLGDDIYLSAEIVFRNAKAVIVQ
jgi:Flp pilus assembly protein TadG